MARERINITPDPQLMEALKAAAAAIGIENLSRAIDEAARIAIPVLRKRAGGIHSVSVQSVDPDERKQ